MAIAALRVPGAPGGMNRSRVFKSVRVRGVLSLLLVMVLSVGCSPNEGVYVIAPDGRATPALSEQLPTGNLDYRVSPLDVLQIEVHPVQGRQTLIDYGASVRIEADFGGRAYAIAPGDTLNIDIDAERESGGPVVVRPDGHITLAQLGKDIRAAGLTPQEITVNITDAYRAIMRSPRVTVSVVRSNNDARERISGTYQVGTDGKIVVPILGSFSARGQSPDALARRMESIAKEKIHNTVKISASLGQLTGRDVDPRIDPNGRSFFRGAANVSPDGTVFVQPAGLIKVSGLTLDEARTSLLAKLQVSYVNPIDVSVSLAESTANTVFIGGEVRNPGRYTYAKSMTLLRLLAMSGWTTEVGDLTRVVLLHPSGPGQYTVYRSNLTQVLEQGVVGQDLAVGPQDIVVVPMTTIGEVNKFVEQYIKRVLPFSTTAGYALITNPTANTTTQASPR